MAPHETPETGHSVYSSLPVLGKQSIRLFRLTSGKHAQIRGTLRVVDLADAPVIGYDALSYTWGSPHPRRADLNTTPSRPIFCNSESQPILVTGNLAEFLQCLGASADPPEFWIDAICIDQSSIAERNEQVQFMSKVYKLAHSTVVWLGQEDEGARDTCELVKRLAHARRRNPEVLQELELSPSDWQALISFFEHSWFSRVWVLQEVILAKAVTISYGSHAASWDDLVQVSEQIATSGWKIKLRSASQRQASVHSLPYLSMPAIIAAIKRDNNFLHTLIRARRFKATDPRDKVYSLLGVAVAEMHLPAIADRLIPNYSVDVRQVYHEAAVAILEASQDVMLLTCAEGTDLNDSSNPSWVPNWADTRTLGLGATGYKHFSAGPSIAQRITFSADKRVLSLVAGMLDTITHVGESKAEVRRGKLFTTWMAVLSALPPVYPHHVPAQSRMEAFWRTMITDRAGDRLRYPAPDGMRDEFSNWFTTKMRAYTQAAGDLPEQLYALRELWGMVDNVAKEDPGGLIPTKIEFDALGTRQAPQSNIVDDGDDDAKPYATTFTHAEHLRLFRTQNQYIGLGSQSVQVDDSV